MRRYLQTFFKNAKTEQRQASINYAGRFWGLGALALCIVATLVLVLCIAIWGIRHDFEQIEQTFLTSEMGRVRALATEGTTAYMQRKLRQSQGPITLKQLHGNERVRQYWSEVIDPDPSRLYGAVVDPSGMVVMHLDRSREGQQLGSMWYDRVAPEAGDNVVDTHDPALTGGKRVLDLRVPILVDNVRLGDYHVGMDYDWLQEELAKKKSALRCFLVLDPVRHFRRHCGRQRSSLPNQPKYRLVS